jgi:hypothetical protein
MTDLDDGVGQKLWELSENLVGLNTIGARTESEVESAPVLPQAAETIAVDTQAAVKQ